MEKIALRAMENERVDAIRFRVVGGGRWIERSSSRRSGCSSVILLENTIIPGESPMIARSVIRAYSRENLGVESLRVSRIYCGRLSLWVGSLIAGGANRGIQRRTGHLRSSFSKDLGYRMQETAPMKGNGFIKIHANLCMFDVDRKGMKRCTACWMSNRTPEKVMKNFHLPQPPPFASFEKSLSSKTY
eukprot:1383385-Amorphochlora_amoeboformis.AAC.1